MSGCKKTLLDRIPTKFKTNMCLCGRGSATVLQHFSPKFPSPPKTYSVICFPHASLGDFCGILRAGCDSMGNTEDPGMSFWAVFGSVSTKIHPNAQLGLWEMRDCASQHGPMLITSHQDTIKCHTFICVSNCWAFERLPRGLESKTKSAKLLNHN